MGLHRAFTAIQRDHQQNGRLPYCTGCDRLITDHAAHIADLQIAYLRDNLGQHPEFFADLTIHQRRLVARFVADWSCDEPA